MIALIPFYAGTRITEIVGLDVDGVRVSARKGVPRIFGKGERVREIPIHPQLRATITGWLDERPDWPGADTPALFLNQRGGRLSVKGAHDVITTIATTAGLEDEDITAHVLRHTFATRLVRGHTDLVIVAELLGHARLRGLGTLHLGLPDAFVSARQENLDAIHQHSVVAERYGLFGELRDGDVAHQTTISAAGSSRRRRS